MWFSFLVGGEIGFLTVWISVGLARLGFLLCLLKLWNGPSCWVITFLGLRGAWSRASSIESTWSEESVFVCYTCEYARQMLAGFQAAGSPRRALLAVLVTWWHTVASGVQSGLTRANKLMHRAQITLLLQTFSTSKDLTWWVWFWDSTHQFISLLNTEIAFKNINKKLNAAMKCKTEVDSSQGSVNFKLNHTS